MSESPLMSTQDVADFFGVSPRSVLRWVDIGLLAPQIRTPGGQRRFAREDVETLFERLRAGDLPSAS